MSMHLVQTLSSRRQENTETMDKNLTTQRILNLTLEIIYVLTGEDYEVVKKHKDNANDCSRSCESEKLQRSQRPVEDPLPPDTVTNEKNPDLQILEPTNKLLRLLTREPPRKREDITVCFTVEEKDDDQEEVKDYKEVLIEESQVHHSLGGSSNRYIPEAGSNKSRTPGCAARDHKMNKGREMFNVTYKEEEIPTEISPDTSSSRSDKGKRKDRRICYSPDGMKDKNDSSPEPQNDHEDEVLIVQCKEEEIPTEISSGLAVSWDDKAESYECFPFAGAGTGFRPVNLPNLSAPEAFPPNFSSSEEEFLAAGPPADPRSMDRTSSISKYNRIDTNRMTNTGQDLGLNFTNAVHFYTPRPAQSATARSPNQPGISYICSDCGKEFKQHRLLLRHKKIHTGEKPFTCLDCGSAFRLSSELLTHRRKHTGERPYACPDCDKCFKHNRNLKTHRLSHIGEKPFSCAECHKSFRARSVLVRHRLIHTGEKPYSCSFCDRRFIQKSNLLRHLVVHTRGKTLN